MENWKQKPSNGGRRPNADYNGKKSEQPPKEKIFPNIDVNREFKPSWIISGIDGDFIKFAENVGGYMAENGVKSSKIRSIYSEIKRIQMNFEKETTAFYLLKPKVAYAYGRNKTSGLGKFKEVFDKCFEHIKEEKHYLNFCNIMEAIVAYHKANVKGDD